MSELIGKLKKGLLENFSNDEKIPEKQWNNLNLRINEKVFKEFQVLSMKFFIKEKQFNNFNNINFMKVCIHNIQKIFLEKYSEIIPINEEFKAFYIKGGRSSVEQAQYYNDFNKSKINISLGQEFYEMYFNLMHTFYIKEMKNKSAFKYSINYFFYDMFNIVKENIDNFENIEFK